MIQRKVQRRWTGIPNFPQYMISHDGRVRRVMASKGAQVGRDLKRTLATQRIENGVVKNYYQITLSKDGKLYTRSLRKLILLSFTKHSGSVYELKIKKNSGNVVRRERTRLITEIIGHDSDDLNIENIRFNFPKRGVRHWNHKLNNQIINLIRNNLDSTVNDLVARYGDMGVTPSTIQAVLRGKSWRVRTEPFATMTFPRENL